MSTTHEIEDADTENLIRVWKENANAMLRQRNEERKRNRALMKLIWAIVMKVGGEVRISQVDHILQDDWELIEEQDWQTMEQVIRARLHPAKLTTEVIPAPTSGIGVGLSHEAGGGAITPTSKIP